MFWGKFSDAAADLRKWQPTTRAPNSNKIILEALDAAELFYMPAAHDVLEGKLLDEDIRASLRLPFDCVALLSECAIGAGMRRLTDGRRVWVSSAYVHGKKDGFVGKVYDVVTEVLEQ